MSDPLGLLGSAGASRPGAIRPTASPATGGSADAASGPDAPSFSKSLMNQLDEANRLQAEAGKAVEDLVTGKRDDLENVMVGAQKADAAFRMLLQLRNKVQAAYDEIKQVRI